MITRISTKDRKLPSERLSWELLAKISGTTVKQYKEFYDHKYGQYKLDCRPLAEGIECPFGERDLLHDTCYIGGGVHKCPYFVRYNTDDDVIECNHPPKPRYREGDLF